MPRLAPAFVVYLSLALTTLTTLACAPAPTPPAMGAMRIVSLAPSATESLLALDAGSLIVGVDNYSKSAALPNAVSVGSFLEPDLEAMLRLGPTLVVLDDVQTKLIPPLTGANIKVVRCPMHAIVDVKHCMRQLGDALGKAALASQRIAELDAALDGARLTHTPSLRILALIDHGKNSLEGAVAAGPGSWLDELLRNVGAANALGDDTKRYVPLGAEELLAAAPDVILDVTMDIDEAAVRARLEALPFARRPILVFLRHQALSAPSPRVIEAIAKLRAELMPIAANRE
ncbi:MAG: ABC transporter substrate-binding protein [Myxococcales bacterium]|nr:ABC transporter substrate-binding protein [Myxococcales bacterium]